MPSPPGPALCSRCGNLITSEAPGDAAATALGSPRPEKDLAGQGPPATGEISWEVSVPLLTNRFIMYDLLKVWGISSLILFLFLTGIAVYDWKWRAFTGMLPLVGLVSAVVTGALNPGDAGVFLEPVSHGIQPRSPGGHGGQPQPARALGQSPGRGFRAPWPANPGWPGPVCWGWPKRRPRWPGMTCGDVNIHAPARVISLMDSWHVVMRLYCTPQNYDVVLTAVQRWAARG